MAQRGVAKELLLLSASQVQWIDVEAPEFAQAPQGEVDRPSACYQKHTHYDA